MFETCPECKGLMYVIKINKHIIDLNKFVVSFYRCVDCNKKFYDLYKITWLGL